MSFLRRVFSADYRAAVAAEAAGNVDLAAERYALAGEADGAVRMHIARAARAGTRQAEIAALRDAMRWAGNEPALLQMAAKALGRALWENLRVEGVATERDRAKVREAAELLVVGEDHQTAGEALEVIGDLQGAAAAYSAGGYVEKMEATLAKDDAVAERARDEADAFANYETHMRVGRRDDARAELARALANAAAAGEYRRMLDQLDTALLTGGRVELRRRGKPSFVACAAPKIVIGRDALCDLPLRAGGVSRQHAEIDRTAEGFQLRDLDSRNGTTLAGMPLVGKVPLAGVGRFGLGDECTIDFEVSDGILILRLANGLDRGVALIAGDDGQRLAIAPLGPQVPGLEISFARGRPLLGRGSAKEVTFNDEPLGELRVQLIRGDRIVADGDEIDVG
ncbi:MAG TPA: FHA domain-containing protein [Kofleriaceae bacterium]|nr:FHA domain-containing protein [Kofleriaceae bacterium]